jgi:hypothetical protein
MILLQDSSSGIWLLGVTDGGVPDLTPSSGIPQTLFLNDSVGNSWQVGVTTLGALTATPVTNAAYGTAMQLISPSGYSFGLFLIPAGVSQADFVTAPSGFSQLGSGGRVFMGRMRTTQRSEHLE